jgi:ribosomal protein L29
LTEEQRKAKLDDLRQKLAEKRAKQALVNVEENKANEVSPSARAKRARKRPVEGAGTRRVRGTD